MPIELINPCPVCKGNGVISLPPERIGYYKSHIDAHGNQVWKSPEGDEYLFPPGQDPHVVIPCGACILSPGIMRSK